MFKLKKKWRKRLDWIETQWNLLFVLFDSGVRWVVGDTLGDIYDYFYVLFLQFNTFMERQGSDGDMDKICIDQDGLHFKGEEWQNTGVCNHKVCAAHDLVKELRCPVLPTELPKGCQLIKGDCDKNYPRCCDRIKCNLRTVMPIIEPANPVYHRQESYKYI